MGLKVAKSLRQTPVLVERHHLVGAPDAVEDVHVAGIRSSLGIHARSRDNYVAAGAVCGAGSIGSRVK